jgi:hypothetical protein
MIDKPDPAKDGGRTDAPGTKRPHATLDIKATEVKPAQPATTPSTTPQAALGAPAAGASKSPPSAGSAPSSSSAAPATPASGADASSSKTAAAASASPKPASSAPDPKAARSGGGFFSHLAAGVIGGALVYAGASFLGPNWLPGLAGGAPDVAARIAALEEASQNLPALQARLGDIEGRSARIDDIERNVAGLGEAQSALQAETKALGEAVPKTDAAAERLSRLEEQLSMIASGASGAGGDVPHLAAISGKIADLQSSLGGEIAALRKSLPADAEEKLAAAEEAMRSLGRELSDIRSEQARVTQKAETAKADTDRISGVTAAAKEEVARLAAAVGELRSSIDSQLKTFARPADVAAAVDPITSKVAEIEQNVQTIASNEQSRQQNAERIVLSLELSNLKRALDRGQGQGYAAEIDEVQKASAGQLDLAPLERFKDTGVATPAELKAQFRPLINAVIDADLEPADGSVIDRLLAGAKSVVRVRRVSHDAEDTSTEAIVARMEAAIDEGRLGDVLAQAKLLPQRARVPIEDWLTKVTARDTVDQAIAAVDQKLKASLAGAPEPAASPAPVQN